MSNYLNQDNEKFLEYYNDNIFIDKSLLIRETNNSIGKASEKYMCVTRPRRFGKTMALSMLNAYYSKGCDSKELFNKLKISNDSSFDIHLNKHNVIWIDMASLYTDLDYESTFIKKLQSSVIEELNEMFPGVLTLKETTIALALKKIKMITNEKFIFLIDEWDVLLRESNNENLKNSYIKLLRTLFKSSDTSKCFELVYMTGILPIKRYKAQSTLNIFEEFTMLEPQTLSKYFGFTTEEVEFLCNKYDMDFNEMKRWYDGYNLNNIEIYNPKSVVKAIKLKKFNDYWISTSAVESANNYIKYQNGNLYKELLDLINEKKTDVIVSKFDNDIKMINSKDAALTLLIHLGYLSYDGEGLCRIPNYEIKNEMLKNLTDLEESPFREMISLSTNAIIGIFNNDIESINNALSYNHKKLANSFNKNNESVLGCIVGITFLPLQEKYTQLQEVNCVTGRADIVYIPKSNNPPIIVELKVDRNCLTATEQIKNKGYTNTLGNYHGKVYIVGINYDNKTLEHNTLVEEIEI